MKKNVLENLNTEQKAETDYSPEEQIVKEKIENKAKGYYSLKEATQITEGVDHINQTERALVEIAREEGKCGNIYQAIQVATSINSEGQRARAIIGIAETEAGRENIDKLLKLIENINYDNHRAQAIIGIAETEAGRENIDKLTKLAESIDNKYEKTRIMNSIYQVELRDQIKQGNINEAIQLIKNTNNEEHKLKPIIDIAQSEHGYQRIDELIELTKSMKSGRFSRAMVLAGIANSKGGYKRRRELLRLTSHDTKPKVTFGAIQGEVNYGNIDQAMKLVEAIIGKNYLTGEGIKVQAIVYIAQSEQGHQKIDELIGLVKDINGEELQSTAITGIANSEGGYERVDEIMKLAKNIDEERFRMEALAGIANSEGGYQRVDEIMKLVVDIKTTTPHGVEIDILKDCKSKTIVDIAQSHAKYGNIDKAIQIAESIDNERLRTEALAGVAESYAKYAGELISENNIELSLEELKETLVKGVKNKDKKLIRAIGVIANDEDFKEISKESKQDIKDLLLSDRIKVYTFKDKDNLKEITDSYIQRFNKAIEGSQSDKQQIKLFTEILRNLRNNQYDDDQSIKDILRQVAIKLPADSEQLPRLLKILCEIKDNNSHYLAFRLSAQKKIPEKIFSYVIKKLESKQYLPKETLEYLKPENIDSLKRLINEYPNQFSNTIDIISKIEGYDLKTNEDEIFTALNDLKTLTPIIFDRYRNSKGTERTKLVHKINKLKSQFFQNKPIKNMLKEEDQEIIDEMTYIAYKPIGMEFARVKELISKVEDRTNDLKEYNFPENGYDFELSKGQTYILKTNENIDFKRISELKTLFSKEYPKNDKDIENIRNCLLKVAKAGTNLNSEEISSILSMVCDDENIKLFKENYRNVDESNTYHFLNELYENIGIYFKDSYSDYLHKFLNENKKIFSQIKNILKQEKRQNVIKQKLGKEQSKHIESKDFEKDEGIVGILSTFMSSKILQKVRLDIKKEIKKFERTKGDKNKSEYRKKTKAYISKNVGSFFAKASAGICTAGDVGLFNRKDHFHINIVEEEQFVRANIQAYIVEVDKKKSLLLRGINPNTDFLKDIDIESFCEKVFEISKKFKADNKLNNVYITEQGGWHALSNRQQVHSFLKKYLNKKNEKKFEYNVAKNCAISRIYRIE